MKPASKPAENPAMPDIDVLEAAIAAANEDEPAAAATPQPAGDKGPDGTAATISGMPALTLDKTLDDKRKKGVDLDAVAKKLSKAGSLNDLTDTVAETLFGDTNFNAIAAEVVSNPPPGMSAPGEAAVKDPSLVLELQEVPRPAEASEATSPTDGPKEMGHTDKLDMSLSMRLDMVKELNNSGATTDNTQSPDGKAGGQAAKKSTAQPESIEEQMKTAMTGTLKTLSSADAPPAPLEKDEPKDKKSGGLFSRLGRSS